MCTTQVFFRIFEDTVVESELHLLSSSSKFISHLGKAYVKSQGAFFLLRIELFLLVLDLDDKLLLVLATASFAVVLKANNASLSSNRSFCLKEGK